ncbi:hypothetical protein [Nonomuraea sp. NPDC050202]|uniref:hypothetical protein n=1 Tax=Nonomuraea sp. NPDC050202 TaxID=3155035 RepID=UPI0033C50036
MSDLITAVLLGMDIDYSGEPGPFWLVFVNEVAIQPERPLPFRCVMAAFEQAVRDHPGQEIGVAPCGPEDLANAGIITTHREDNRS